MLGRQLGNYWLLGLDWVAWLDVDVLACDLTKVNDGVTLLGLSDMAVVLLCVLLG